MAVMLETLINEIRLVVQDTAYTTPVLTSRINKMVSRIAAGMRMPDNSGFPRMPTPPLPDLMAVGTVSTASGVAYASLPDDYQRVVFYVADSHGDRIGPISGGGYYDFTLFVNRAMEKDLTEAGYVYMVAVRGTRLYYQGIPTSSEDLTVYYYRKPTDMSAMADTVDGLPDHLAEDLIKHGVCREIFGEGIEDGEDNRGTGYQYHTARFWEAMTDLVDHIGIDGEPQHYGSNNVGRINDWDAL